MSAPSGPMGTGGCGCQLHVVDYYVNGGVGPSEQGTPAECDDHNPCTDDSCDPSRGCVHTNNDAPCNDGDRCTVVDTCRDGTCAGTPVTCSDDDACNGVETCNPATGACQRGAPLLCDDGSACTVDTCDAQDGCRYTPVADFSTCRLLEVDRALAEIKRRLGTAPVRALGGRQRRQRLALLIRGARVALRAAFNRRRVGDTLGAVRRRLDRFVGNVEQGMQVLRIEAQLGLTLLNLARDAAEKVEAVRASAR